MASLTESCSICYEDIFPENFKYKCNDCDTVSCEVCLSNYVNLKNIECPGPKCKNIFEYKSNMSNKINTKLLELLSLNQLNNLDKQTIQTKINLDKQKKIVKNVISDLDKKIRELKQEKKKNLEIFKNLNNNSKGIFNVICRCPEDRCLGIITDENYKCGLCEYKLCKNCWQQEEDEHKCNEDYIKTVKHIKSNTQVCPKCNLRIHKIAGCDHMFCTQCHTSFYYSTGKEFDHTKNTNPEYFAYLRTEKGKKKFGISDDDINVDDLPLSETIRQILTHMTTCRSVISLPIDEYPIDESITSNKSKLSRDKIMEGYRKYMLRHKNNAFHDELESIFHMFSVNLNDINIQINDRNNNGHIMENIGKKYLLKGDDDKTKKWVITQFKTHIKRRGLFIELKEIYEKYFFSVSSILKKHCEKLGYTFNNLVKQVGIDIALEKVQNIEYETLINLLKLRNEIIEKQNVIIISYYSKISSNYKKYLFNYSNLMRYYSSSNIASTTRRVVRLYRR